MSQRKPATVSGFEPLLTIAEAAGFLNLSPRSVMRLIKDQKLPVVRIGRAVRITPQQLRDFIDSS